MTGFLIDTDVVVISIADPKRLPSAVRAVLLDPALTRRISAVSAFEIAVKASLGKLPLPSAYEVDFQAAFEQTLEDLVASVLEVGLRHAVRVRDLPFHHRDPFDRLLIAQAMEENLTIISTDRQFTAYEGLKLLRA